MIFRKIGKLLIVLGLVLALALGGLVTPASADHTAQHECEDTFDGTWVGGDADTGACYISTSLIPGICPGYAYFAIAYVGSSEFAIACVNSIGDGTGFVVFGSFGSICLFLGGGTWDGDFAGENGTCTIPAGSDIAIGACGKGYDLVIVVVDDSVMEDYCVAAGSGGGAGSGGSAYPPFGRFGAAVNGIPGSGSLTLGGGRNGNVAFDPGTCAGKCTISPNLPAGAQGKLPADVVATLYFRTTDTDGNPGTGTYTVCFDASALTSPVIYRYVGNEWVAQPLTYSGGQVCTTASGDGAFALGGS